MNNIMGILCIDFETTSGLPINVGPWAYSEHESTDVYCAVLSFALERGDYDYVTWEPGQQLPKWIVDYIGDGGLMLAHNAAFEISMWENVLAPHYGWPVPELKQWRDTQAVGCQLNLPFNLEGLGRELGAVTQKDTEGAKLMKLMAPRKLVNGEWTNEHNTPENRARLLKYCEIDVGTTLDCWFALQGKRFHDIHEEWMVDMKINARGVYLDERFAASALRVAEERKKELAEEVLGITGGALPNSTGTPALKEWVVSRGVELPVAKNPKGKLVPALNKTTLPKMLLDPDLPDDVRAVLSNRVEANKQTSLAKLKKVPVMVGSDGRYRHHLRFCGAHTGRWAASGVQTHNMPKDHLSPVESDLVGEAIDREMLGLLTIGFDRPLHALSQRLRSVIAAEMGYDLIAADYSAIEARCLVWLAGQQDLVDFFFQFDYRTKQYRAGEIDEKPIDSYQNTARDILNKRVIDEFDRQLGKACDLGLGYQMGVPKAAVTFAGWGVELPLPRVKELHTAWREARPMIVDFWSDVQNLVIKAINKPGKWHDLRHISACTRNGRLEIRLPSGRSLFYWRPHMRMLTKEVEAVGDDGKLTSYEKTSNTICFMTVADDHSSMRREITYGGKLVENITQAVARDLLGHATRVIDATGRYPLVMHVHDSLAAEVPEGTGDVDEFCALMADKPEWAKGIPIAVEGYRAKRFKG